MNEAEIGPSYSSVYSEDALVERPAIALFAELGWETVNCFNERFGARGTLGRATKADVVLVPRLRKALARLNPGVAAAAIDGAVEELARERSALSLAHANQEIYKLLKDGVKVNVRDDAGEATTESVRVIDWDAPANNDFLLASQVWVTGEVHTKRADLVGFVNGLPLVLVELKAPHEPVKDAYDKNLRDYKRSIPHLFWFNGLILLSNGGTSRVGSVTAGWEHFGEWKRIDDEGAAGSVSLETAIRGTCDPGRLLDLVENFTLFAQVDGKPAKLLAKNHQVLGVNRAVAAMARRDGNEGRLGVFWHTQGSGKSYSMVFFAMKVLRKLPGDFTFVVVTDRDELDDQIAGTFANAGVLTETKEEVQAASGEHLRRLLRGNHRVLFTLIQKFRSPSDGEMPTLSARSDVVVMTDEAHRSQYDLFALNMRRALPNASFIGFTGTPLMGDEEKTRRVFGDYVSVYNFRQSVEDGATVPLFYENRIPELQLTNDDLNADLEALIEDAALDEAQERKLEREFAREYHLITRDERLERIAADVVGHFVGRGFKGKAMLVAIDKATAVKMFDKVRAHWRAELERRRAEWETLPRGAERAAVAGTIAFMDATEMAVVVSEAPNEDEIFAAKGLAIAPHRERMRREKLEQRFKDANDLFRLVFVTAMWITGFDVPSLSTVYLDKPMRNHTLMQTIARANRVFPGKRNGLIVDYVGVFRDLQRALAIYGSGAGGGIAAGETPVRPKAELVAALREEIAATTAFLGERGVDAAAVLTSSGFERVRLLQDAVEAILANDETKRRYLALANAVALGYRAILPDLAADEFRPPATLFAVIAQRIRAETASAEIDTVMEEVEELLDASIATEGYVIREGLEDARYLVDLSQIDLDALQTAFATGRPHTEAERLKGAIERKLRRLVELNRTRTDYLRRFQELIDAYNAGSRNVQLHFDDLVAFAQELTAEEQRAITAHVSEEELAVFDLLTKPGPQLTDKETEQVKKVARELLATLKRGRLVLDWRRKQQARARVRVTIEKTLREQLPPVFSLVTVTQKTNSVYDHVYDSYVGQGQGIYAGPAAEREAMSGSYR